MVRFCDKFEVIMVRFCDKFEVIMVRFYDKFKVIMVRFCDKKQKKIWKTEKIAVPLQAENYV